MNRTVSAISPKLKGIQPLGKGQDLAPAVLTPEFVAMESQC
jgi:hypothetical protein